MQGAAEQVGGAQFAEAVGPPRREKASAGSWARDPWREGEPPGTAKRHAVSGCA